MQSTTKKHVALHKTKSKKRQAKERERRRQKKIEKRRRKSEGDYVNQAIRGW